MTRTPKPRVLIRRKKSLSNLLLIVPALAVMGGISAGSVWLIYQLQFLRCPTGTFLVGSGRLASIFQVIPIFFASIGFGLLIVNWLAHALPPVRDFFDRDAQRHGERSYRASQCGLLMFSAIVLTIALPIIVTASLSQFCLVNDAILYQRWPWSGLQRYAWSDVKGVETTCVRGSRGSWDGSFLLILRDGIRFDLMAWPRAVVRAYPEITQALNAGNFSFNSSGVRPGCDVPYVNLLRNRP